MEDGRQSPHLHLDLYNFEEGRGSRYVLTSPRSPECLRPGRGVRPDDLSTRPPRAGGGGTRGLHERSSEMYEAHEERRKKVRICREERIQLMEEQRDWKTPGGKDSNHGLVIIEKVECPPAPTTSPDWWDKQVPSNPKEAKSPAPTLHQLLGTTLKTNQGLPTPKRVKSPTSTNCSEQPQTQATVLQPKEATSPGHIERPSVIPKKDKKIAALMLIKFHEEEAKKRRLEAEQAWEGVMSEERNFRERMIQAIKAKLLREFQNKKNIQVKNEYEKLRHSRLKQQLDNQMKGSRLFKRMSIQQKELKAHELYEQLIEERNRELKEKAAKEEEQIIMARIRADHQEKLHWRHKKMLVQQTEQRIQCAKDCLEKSIQTKAEKTRELNLTKEKTHLILKKRVAEEEENHRKEVEHLIRIKDKKSDKVLKEKEAVIDEGRRIARASFQIREKIREHTKCRTFDQMARQAQFNASLIKESPFEKEEKNMVFQQK
ncbi:LOW QUALITY PROTEIN: coiled-coil domain-containing protein 185 [Discoglossus pictus]